VFNKDPERQSRSKRNLMNVSATPPRSLNSLSQVASHLSPLEQKMRSTVAYHAALEVVTDLLILSCSERLFFFITLKPRVE